MSAKSRAFLYNFLSFGLIFITLRFIVNFLLPELNYWIAVTISGFTTIFLAPRFGAFEKQGREVVLMKWIFFKDIKEV
ncbi:hypothetical protein [Capnocytophaga catalasegens]|uniref:Uncharacterized protein n=1 Tax=Capnocytophaga catalasegens TaxID=1004260 RepID=A0AAV5ATN3_9FLAO|nr:hypothetical protein [Capnocytophaga catalasegens]GIZ15120.1 hypothetical protein RCZ03_11200 [Capnocytophaga catalasegens]GJM49635.1 hypothetical protein RCZ15_06100 [Capnocytophaga catalasegens]GJM52700.1 hypothetical protein RCZ16_10170 [Capnocytophaga catalasegens]